jgi:type II secretory pathway predicted ATPase ExeA
MDENRQAFFGLHRPPFAPVIEPAQLIGIASRNRLIDAIIGDIQAECGIIILTGEPGVGKTTLMQIIAARLSEVRVIVFHSSGALSNPVEIQQRIADTIGLKHELNLDPQHLLNWIKNNNNVRNMVLLFDDADVIPSSTLHYIWLLRKLFKFGDVALSLVLIGGVGRWQRLGQPDLIGLQQIAKRRLILPLNDDEAATYLAAKLRYAGGSVKRLMTDAAKSELLDRAYGIPRHIETLAECAFDQAYRNGRQRVNLAILSESGENVGIAMSFAPIQSSWRSASLAVLAVAAVASAATVITLRNSSAIGGWAFAIQALAHSAPVAALPDARGGS